MQFVLSNYFWLCSLSLKAVCGGNSFSQASVELFGTTAVYIRGVMLLRKQVKTSQIKQKQNTIIQKLSSFKSSSNRVRHHAYLPLWDCVCLNLGRSLECSHTCVQFICSIPMFLDGTISLTSSTMSSSSNTSAPFSLKTTEP